MKTGCTLDATLALVALAATVSGCGLHDKPAVERRVGPVAASTERGAAARPSSAPASGDPERPATVVAPGIVEPAGGEIALAAQESGWITRITVAEGAHVEVGEVLAMLDDAPQRSAVSLAEADLAAVVAELARIEAGATVEELRQARAEVEGAAARARLARSASVRARLLHERDAIPDSEAERALVEERVQSALVERSEARLLEVERGARVEDRNAARARVAAARARLGVAKASLSRRRVVAPSAGEVLLSRFHAGEYYEVGAGPLLLLGETERLRVRLEVDEIDALAVSRGARCTLVSDGGAPLAEGMVDRVAPRMGRRRLSLESPTARADVRVREVFVDVVGPSALVPGQRVWGHASRAPASQAAVLPVGPARLGADLPDGSRPSKPD